ncbi:flagellar hook capping FlgD N-terminal domain-containing protein [Bosea sp. 685]|uniref:flagellar hook capping FlgD N-terminal domain-containing protein n=1 Tax=Bosea sp. 685 TaxID=3080057 RepID=UPI0028936609|nr:flagellar hook capping FlgD N-terminal domain-containing protein [Bosea sp. 685]WNJ90954.1 flagellar hook capping FlgD N-terminal domain-containing protein [Bosea sp. 685]
MSVSSVSSAASTASTTSTSSSSSSSALTETDFMQLIVSQLQNQDPSNPTSASDMNSQMMSYASYSQQVAMNDTLSSLSESMTTLSSTVSDLYSSVNTIASQLNISA